jgi:hypothetical protein
MAARTGVEASTAPAMPARQSLASMSATALGRVSTLVAGNTARATPAALAVGSAPPMRVVFFVANAGKPRSAAASGSEPFAPTVGPSLDCRPAFLLPPPQPAAARAASRQATADAGRRMEDERYERRPTPARVGRAAHLCA